MSEKASRPPAAGLPPASSRAAATNRPASRWDTNTATGRRCRDLFRTYVRAAGNPTDEAKVTLVVAAAEMMAIAEQARSDHLAGNDVKLNDVVRIESSASKALRRIGLSNDGKAGKPTKLSQKDIAARYAGGAASPPMGEAAK